MNPTPPHQHEPYTSPLQVGWIVEDHVRTYFLTSDLLFLAQDGELS